MKKRFVFVLIGLLVVSAVWAMPSAEKEEVVPSTIMFTDSCGRTVELPSNITRVAPSGNVATMVFSVLAPEYMTNVNSKQTSDYIPDVVKELPETGQLYGGKATLNTEEIIALGAQVLVDIGDYKKGIEDDLDALQEQIGIPCIFLSGDLASGDLGNTFSLLGSILEGKEERGAELKAFVDKTVEMAKENSAKVKDEERVSVMFAGGKDGLGTNAKSSSQAQVIEMVGCDNAITVEKVSAKGNGNQINMEQLYNFDPDIIVFCEDSYYDRVASDSSWSVLSAVENGKYYEVPCDPYCWLGTPPSLNMILGVWYLGNLAYPQYYDYDINEVADEIYNLFWGCDCNYTL